VIGLKNININGPGHDTRTYSSLDALAKELVFDEAPGSHLSKMQKIGAFLLWAVLLFALMFILKAGFLTNYGAEIIAEGVKMKPLTAFCIVLVSLGLFSSYEKFGVLGTSRLLAVKRPGRVWPYLLLPTLTFLIAFSGFIYYISGYQTGLDRVVADQLLGLHVGTNQRMSANTAVCLMLLAVAQSLQLSAKVTAKRWAEYLCQVVGYSSWLCLIAHLFGVKVPSTTANFVLIGWPSAISLFLLAFICRMLFPQESFLGIVAQESKVAKIARQQLVVALVLPVLAAFFLLKSQIGSGEDPAFLAALIAIFTSVGFTFFVIWGANETSRQEQLTRLEQEITGQIVSSRYTQEALSRIISLLESSLYLKQVQEFDGQFYFGHVLSKVAGVPAGINIRFKKLEKVFSDKEIAQALKSAEVQLAQLAARQHNFEALSASEARLDAIVNSMAEGVVVANASGKVVFYNQAAIMLHGTTLNHDIPASEWSQRYQLILVDSYGRKHEGPPRYSLALNNALQGEITVEEVSVATGTKEQKYLEVMARPLTSRTNITVGGIMVLHDISERKIVEKRLREFYSIVSHELRTPLTSIRGSLSLLDSGLAGPITEESHQLLSIALKETERLVRLINDILDIKKIEAGRLNIKKETLEIKVVVEEVMIALAAIARERKVHLEASFDPGCLNVEADKDRLAQVLNNLLANAIKFSPEDSTITIAVAPEILHTGTRVIRFSVTDQGSGISEEDQEKLFKMFQQIDSSDSRIAGGTGLGLAISKAIVEKMGGTIAVDSKPGKGSTFWFRLPVPEPVSAL
jgi:signal transduction histidine kinase